EKTTERGYFNWCIIIWPPCVERMGRRRRSERIGLQSLSNPSYARLSLRSHWPRVCIIYSHCSAYDGQTEPPRTESNNAHFPSVLYVLSQTREKFLLFLCRTGTVAE